MTPTEISTIALSLNLQEWKTLLSEGSVRVATQRLARWTGTAQFDAKSFDLAPIGKFGDSSDCVVTLMDSRQLQLCFPADVPDGSVTDIALNSVAAFHAVDCTAIESLSLDAARVGVRISGADAADAWNHWLQSRLLARHFRSGSRLASLFGLPLPETDQEKWLWRMSAFNGHAHAPVTSAPSTALDALLLNYADVFDTARGFSETDEHGPRAAIALAEIAHGLDAMASDELNALATREFAEPQDPLPTGTFGEVTVEAPLIDVSVTPDNPEPEVFWTRFPQLAPNALDTELTAQLLSDLLRTVHRARNGRLLPKLVMDAVNKTAIESGDAAARAHAFILGTVLGPSKVQTLAIALDPSAIPDGIASRTTYE
jgi:hypothetical protein